MPAVVHCQALPSTVQHCHANPSNRVQTSACSLRHCDLRRLATAAPGPHLGICFSSPSAPFQVDVYHTFFGIAGLSLMGRPGLAPIDPTFALPEEVVQRLQARRRQPLAAAEGQQRQQQRQAAEGQQEAA